MEERTADMGTGPPPEVPSESRVWLSTTEAAARAGRHSPTVADACRTGDLVAMQGGLQG
jgi:hypothetical protein